MLNDYYRNLSRHGQLDNTKIWVVGDLKTPSAARDLCESVSDRGLETVFLGIEEQSKMGESFPEFYGRLPFNNETRRNIGFLAAYADGCDRLISIDDDNFPTEEDFIGKHMCVGGTLAQDELSSASGYYNICSHLEFEPPRIVYPRGYPFLVRGLESDASFRTAPSDFTIGVNVGLWLLEPDVDATTWLNGQISARRYTGSGLTVLGASTWTPINTQNTCVMRELVPAYLCIPMGWEVPGGKIQRYGDIWGGYFLQALMQETNLRVSFGGPIVEHRRNKHNYLDDMRYEYWGMILTDWLIGLLRARFHPQEPTILLRVFELARFLRDVAITELPVWCPDQVREFILWTAGNLASWGEALKIIDERSAIADVPCNNVQLEGHMKTCRVSSPNSP